MYNHTPMIHEISRVLFHLAKASRKEIRCSKCGKALVPSLGAIDFYCRKCEMYVCERCLRPGRVCPACRTGVVSDGYKTKGNMMIFMGVFMMLIFGLLFLILGGADTSGGSFSDYDVGDEIVLAGPIISGNADSIVGWGAPGNISWEHDGYLTMKDDRGGIRVAIGPDTKILPCHIVPEADLHSATYNYSFGSEHDVVVTAIVSEDDSGERYYRAVEMYTEDPMDTFGAFVPGEMVLLDGNIDTGDGLPLTLSGKPGNVTWSGSGTFVVCDRRGNAEVGLSNYTGFGRGLFGYGDVDIVDDGGATGDELEIANGTRIRVLALAAGNDTGGSATFEALEIIIPGEEDEGDDRGLLIFGIAFGIMGLMFLSMIIIGIVLLRLSVKRRKKYRERSISTIMIAAVSGREMRGHERDPNGLDAGDMQWFGNGTRERYMRNARRMVIVCLVISFLTGLFGFLSYKSVQFTLVGLSLLILPLLGMTILIALALYFAFKNTAPVKVGVGPEGFTVEYLKEPAGDSLGRERWKDIDSIMVHAGGGGAWMIYQNETRKYLGMVDPEIVKNIRKRFRRWKREHERDREQEVMGSEEGKAGLIQRPRRKLCAGPRKLPTASPPSIPEGEIEWRKPGVSNRRRAKIISGIFVLLFVAGGAVLWWLTGEWLSMVVMVVIVSTVISLILILLASSPVDRIGLSPLGIHMEKKRKKRPQVRAFIPYRDIEAITGPVHMVTKLRDGESVRLMVPGEDREWLTEGLAAYWKKIIGRDKKTIDESGVTWVENAYLRKARLQMLPVIIILSLLTLAPLVAAVIMLILGEDDYYIFFIVSAVIIPVFGVMIHTLRWSAKTIPVAVGTSRDGLFVKWSKGISEKRKTFKNLAWEDVKNVKEENVLTVRGTQVGTRSIIVTDIWLREYRIQQIGDKCANAMVDEWERRKGE